VIDRHPIGTPAIDAFFIIVVRDLHHCRSRRRSDPCSSGEPHHALSFSSRGRADSQDRMDHDEVYHGEVKEGLREPWALDQPRNARETRPGVRTSADRIIMRTRPLDWRHRIML
jgi:hypothetical protein